MEDLATALHLKAFPALILCLADHLPEDSSFELLKRGICEADAPRYPAKLEKWIRAMENALQEHGVDEMLVGLVQECLAKRQDLQEALHCLDGQYQLGWSDGPDEGP